MATRGPPPWAPAWGRRRQDAGNGGVRPGNANNGDGNNGNGNRGVGNGNRGVGNGRGVGNARHTNGGRDGGVGIATSPGANAAEDVESILSRASEPEDRNKKRRLDDHQYKAFINQRAERGKITRHRFHRRYDQARKFENKGFRRRQTRIGQEANGRREVQRALGGIERAAGYLLQGRGPEAALVLSREARAARQSSTGFEPQSPTAKVLGALSSNMEMRTKSIRGLPPGQAKKLAHNMQRVARGTEGRAASLERGGHRQDARLLRGVARDSRAQATLTRAAGTNSDALMGRAIAKTFLKMARAAHPKSQRASPNLPSDSPRGDLGAVFKKLDKSLTTVRTPLHEALAPTPPKSRGQARGRGEAPIDFLRKHAATRDLLGPINDLSVALSRGDVRLAAKARGDILKVLRKNGQLPILQESVGKQGLPKLPKGPLELSKALPEILLHQILKGGLATLAKGGPQGLARILSGLPGLPYDSQQLLPAEKVLNELLSGKPAAFTASDLGPIEGLLLGSRAHHQSLGTITHTLRSIPADLAPSAFAAIDASSLPLSTLPAAAPHELGVLMDPEGNILVRSENGTTWHHGHVVGADDERIYFNTVEVDRQLTRVVYQSSLQPDRLQTRLDMPVDPPKVDGVDPDDLSQRKKQNKTSEEEVQPDNLAVVAVFQNVADPQCGVQGFSTRFAARLAQNEVERMNRELPATEQMLHLYLEFASDCGRRLSALGYRHAGAFQEHLNAALEAEALNPDEVGALVLIAPEVEAELQGGRGLFIDCATQSASPRHAGDPIHDQELIRDGFYVFHEDAVVIR